MKPEDQFSLSHWTEALRTLVAKAPAHWTPAELYAAFRTVLRETGRELPDWPEVATLLEEQARLRRVYANLIPFLETPAAYAAYLDEQVAALEMLGLPRDEARAQTAADALKALAEELELAYGERSTPDLYRSYVSHLEAGGENYQRWIARWLISKEG